MGYEVDLPHEYEWEVVARYPDGRFYPWGNEFDSYKTNTFEGVQIRQTSAIGLYPSGKNEALDLYDLSGNVFEWCRNQYEHVTETAVNNERRVLRGGSWASVNQDGTRAAFRYDLNPGSRFSYYGFRVVVRRPLSHDDWPQGRD